MAVDFSRTFGANSNDGQTSTAGARTEQAKAQFWLNIGYDSGVTDETTGETKFVSLPVGIPLDTQEHVKADQRNDEYAQFMAARNDLLDQIMAVANGLEPGASTMLNLQIQVRRVAAPRAAATVGEGNQFSRKLDLVG